MLGKLLDRRYQVTQVLGAGGFGRTYLAQDTRRPGNPTCVVKQLKPLSSEPTFLETARRLFYSEAEALEQLGNHSQIPRLLAYFEEDQEFYLVQEFIEGHTLSQELQPGQQWAENQVIDLLIEVLTVLDFVHRQGVIHRDIKPDNLIRRNSDKQLVLVDFGAVKQIRTQMATAYGQPSNTIAVGTPGYMPSEQARGQPRPSSDIYALGIIGIQALSGMMPVQLEEDLSTGEILWQHLAPVSRGLANILTRMVRYHFKDRYTSAAEALQALRQLNAYPSTQYPTTPVAPSGNDGPALGQRLPQPSYPTPSSAQYTMPVSPGPVAPPQQLSPAQPNYPPAPQPRRPSRLPLLLGITILVAIATTLGLSSGLREGVLSSIFGGDRDNDGDSPKGTCTVVINALNVRSKPQGSIIKPVTRGTSLSLTGNGENGWVEISSPVQGWVYNGSRYIDCTVASQTPITTPVSPTPVATVTPKASPSPAQPKPVDNGSAILKKAEEKYQSGDLPGAIAQLRGILASGSAAKNEAVATITKWQQEWAAAEAKFNEVQQALNEGRWDDVLIHQSDTGFPEQRYWRGKLNGLIEEAKRRKAEAEASQPQPTPPEPSPSVPSSPTPTPSTPVESGTPAPSPVEVPPT